MYTNTCAFLACKFVRRQGATILRWITLTAVNRQSATPSATRMATSTVLEAPVKSATDLKSYRTVQLPNGLRVLLISDTRVDLDKLDQQEKAIGDSEAEDEEDPEDDDMSAGASSDEAEEEEELKDGCCAKDDEEEEEERPPAKHSTGMKKSAASLCLGMGSFSDPEELPGLAHFLEHMLFMGSDKYPDENEFSEFVSNHGGSDNAHTDCEHTTFYFECHRKHFRQALDRFAQFFIAPLMKKEAMQREREAVDSEFQMSLSDDYSRKQQILSGLARPGHPMGKFMWGNLESLQLAKWDDDKVHEMLHAFQKRHYSAPAMTLALQSQHSLDQMQLWAEQCFGAVPNNQSDRQTFGHLLNPFTPESFHRLYQVVPVQEVHGLELNWALPPLAHQFRVKPLQYLSWILGHEGSGSLIAYLRKQVWALDLTAGNHEDGFELNSTCSMFSITISLTKSGFMNVSKVVQAVFSFIKMLHDSPPSARIYGEIQRIESLAFDYGEEPQPIDNVSDLSESMQRYPPNLYLSGSSLLFDFDAELIQRCTRALAPDNVNIFLMAKELENQCDKVETWFRTKFSEVPIPSEWLLPTMDVLPDFFLPEPNRFIAEDVSLKPGSDDTSSHYPVRVLQRSCGDLFYRQDDVFRQPRAVAYFSLFSELLIGSLDNAVCLDLMVSCMTQQMMESVYPAEMAQLNYSFTVAERGIMIKLNGLNDKLALLLSTIVSHFHQFRQRLTPDMFAAVKDKIEKSYYNIVIKPEKLGGQLRLCILQDEYYDAHAKLRLVSQVSMEQLLHFAQQFLSTPVFVQGLVQGNVTVNEAVQLFDIVAEAVGAREGAAPPRKKCTCLPSGDRLLAVHTLNPKDCNTIVTNYYQLGPGSLQSCVCLELLCLMMMEPVFDRLRTKEQLGYYVSCQFRNTFGVLGLTITVNCQANKFSAAHVDGRIEAFLKWFIENKLASMSDDEFSKLVTSLIKEKKSADVTLEEEVVRNWDEIVSGDYLFDRFEKEVQLLEKMSTKQSMTDFITKLLAPSESRKKLSVQVHGNPTAMEQSDCGGNDDVAKTDFAASLTYANKSDGDETVIDSLSRFKSSLPLHPAIQIIQ